MKTLKITALLFLLLPFESRAQSAKVLRLDSMFTALYNTGQFSGNVLIAENGKAIYQKSFGTADIEKQVPIDAGTRFLIASVSKQFTAAGIMLLKEKGKLSLDDLLTKYLPELPYPDITLRQVLNHTSGLPDYDALMNYYWDKRIFATNDDMLRMLIQYHPSVFFSPGQKYAYSNTGYALLALVIERVSGQSFTSYMEQHVFKALGLTHTLIYTRRARPRKVDNYALGYVYADSLKKFVLPDVHPVWKGAVWEDGIYGEDGVNTTTGDLLTWDQAVFHHRLLTAEDWTAILTPGKPAEGTSDYGFGWHLLGPIAFHSGGWPGYMAYNEQHLDHNQTIIILRNKFSPQTKIPIADIRVMLGSTGK